MKKVRLFLLALATVSFMSFYACNAPAEDGDATEESTEEVVNDDATEAVTEESTEEVVKDSTAEEVVKDSTAEAVNEEATTEEAK